jgi:hypothetical protein
LCEPEFKDKNKDGNVSAEPSVLETSLRGTLGFENRIIKLGKENT